MDKIPSPPLAPCFIKACWIGDLEIERSSNFFRRQVRIPVSGAEDRCTWGCSVLSLCLNPPPTGCSPIHSFQIVQRAISLLLPFLNKPSLMFLLYAGQSMEQEIKGRRQAWCNSSQYAEVIRSQSRFSPHPQLCWKETTAVILFQLTSSTLDENQRAQWKGSLERVVGKWSGVLSVWCPFKGALHNCSILLHCLS